MHSEEEDPVDLSRQRSLAAIALGSNLGNSLATVQAAVQTLAREPDLTLIRQSQWYKTTAVGPIQPDYVNGCVLIQIRQPEDGGAARSPQKLLNLLLEIEQHFGRVRTQRWGPRILDLDLLFYDSVVLHTPTLTLPHPHIAERAFVLVPLTELAPHWIEPTSELSVLQLRDQIDCSGVSVLSE